MSNQSFPMCDFSAIGRLESFKRRVDETVRRAVAAFDVATSDEFRGELVDAARAAIRYRRTGGLNHAKIGNLNVSWSVSKPRPKPAEAAPVEAVAEAAPSVRADRVALAMRKPVVSG